MTDVVPEVMVGQNDSAIFEISRRITEAQLRAKLRAEAPNRKSGLEMFTLLFHRFCPAFAETKRRTPRSGASTSSSMSVTNR